jgi:hypothetical protein
MSDSAPASAPAPEPASAPVAADPQDVITVGQQIAGGLLIFNAIFVLLSAGLIPADPKLGPMFAPARSIMPAIIDVLIGASLLSKKPKYVTWAILRVVLGTVLFTALSITKDPMMAASQVMIGGSLLLLLLGDPGRPRLVAGGAMFFVYALLNIAGLSATALGINPLGPVIQMAIGDIEPGTVSVVTGNASHYRVKTPSSRWYLRTEKAAKKNNALSDRWLTRPDLDAHVLIIAEQEPGKQLSVDLLADAVVENAKRVSVDFEVVSRESMKSNPKKGRIIHTRSTVDNLALENLNGVIAVYEHGYQIIAFAPRVSFPKVEAELRSIIESFELPTDVKPGLPDDAEPGTVSTVTGQLQSYVLTAPDGNWYLRKEAVAKKDNPLSDRWITRPELDAHIMVIAELVEGADLDPDHYANAVADALQANSGATILSREPVTSDPKHGRILYATATVNGLPIAYSYGCFARGEQAFQVVAFAHQDQYPDVKEAFRKAIETFQLPPPRKPRK